MEAAGLRELEMKSELHGIKFIATQRIRRGLYLVRDSDRMLRCHDGQWFSGYISRLRSGRKPWYAHTFHQLPLWEGHYRTKSAAELAFKRRQRG